MNRSSEIFCHRQSQRVGADKVGRADFCALLVVAAHIAVLLARFVFVPLLIEDCATVGVHQQAGEQPHFIILVRTAAVDAELLHPFPGFHVDDGLVGVLKHHLLVLVIVDDFLALIGLHDGLEVHCMPQVFLTFQNVADSIGRLFAGEVGIVPLCVSRPLVVQCAEGWDALFAEHPCNLRWAVARHTQAEDLLHHRRGFRIYLKSSVLAHYVAI